MEFAANRRNFVHLGPPFAGVQSACRGMGDWGENGF